MPMNECLSDIQLKHIENISELNVRMDNVEKTLSDLSIMKDTLIELKFLSKQQLDFNRQQVESYNEFKITLANINENLNGLNTEMKEISGRVGNLEENKEMKIEKVKGKTEIIKSKIALYGSIISTLGLIVVGYFTLIK
jgi:chromosome segregation ATPase